MNDALPHLQLRQLRQLVAVSEAGSIRRAAETLAIAQPALSRSMRSLEEQLEVKLMTRGPRGIELTEYGESLVDYAKIIETNLRFASEEIEDLRGTNGGRVRIGIGPFEGAGIVDTAIHQLMEKRPNAEIAIYQGNFDSLSPRLVNGELDMMCGPASQANPDPGLSVELLTQMQPVVIARQEHPLAQKNKVTIKDLSAVEWSLPYKGTVAREEWETLFTRNGLPPPRAPIECPPSTTSKRIAMRRDVVCLLPRQLLEPELSQGKIKVLPIDNNQFVIRVYLTTREFGKLPPACRDMITELRNVCAEFSEEN